MTTEVRPEVLQECLDALACGESALEACLARYPEQREALAGLLAAARQLQDAPEVQPSTEFRHAARARLLNRLGQRAEGRRSIWAGWLAGWRRLTAPQHALRWASAALLVVMLLAGGTAAFASTDALPGDDLYPVKRGLETARLAVAFSPVERAGLHVDFAERRLWEAEALQRLGRTEAVQQAWQDYNAERGWAVQALAGLEPDQAQAFADVLAAHDARWRAMATARPADATEVAALTATQSRTPTATPSPSATRTPTRTATPVPSASRTGTAVAYPTFIETPVVTRIIGPVVTHAADFTPAGRFCWPSNVPTPERWPENWPTPDPNCPPIPIPTQICWPPGAPTPDPSRWPAGVPTPDPNCWDQARPTRPALSTALPSQWPTAWPTAWPSEWPTPDGTPGPNLTPWWRTPDPSRLPPTTPDGTRLPDSTPAWPTAWPTDWSSVFPTAFPTDWSGNFPTEWLTAWPTVDPGGRPRRP